MSRRRSILPGAPAVCVAVLLIAVGSVASAQNGDEIPVLEDLLPDSELIHRDVAAQVVVDVDQLGATANEYLVARADATDAEHRRAVSEAALGSLTVAAEVLSGRLAEARSVEATAAALAADAEAELARFAIHSFVEGDQGNFDELELRGSSDPEPRLTQEVGGLLWSALDRARDRHAEAAAVESELAAEQRGLEDQMAAAEGVRLSAEADLYDANERLDRTRPGFERAVMTARVPNLDLPLVVLDAYFRAEVATAEKRPECELRWFQLAGIGRVESGHGTFGGSMVAMDGRTSRRILGPVLDGEKFLAIPDTDGGALDGDTTWDRAVGPMQFIPSSWRIFAGDGNGDGVVDPHNIYDAAMAAAEHLCRSHSRLSVPGRFRQALLGYNRSVVYGTTVMGFADDYRTGLDLEILPPVEDETRSARRDAGVLSGLS